MQLPTDGVKLGVCRHQLRALAEGKRRQEPHDELMRVLRERDALGRIVQEPREPPPHLVRLLERLLPHIIDILGRIEPCLLLRFKSNIGPGLMRMPGQKNSLTDPETSVVLRQLFRIDQASAALRRRLTSPPSAGVTTQLESPTDPETRAD